MSKDYFKKQPYEAFTVGADFENVMASTESIVVGTSAVTAEDKYGTDVSDSVLVDGSKAVSGFKLQIRVQAGSESASPYKITYKAVTDTGEQYEVDQYMQVEEK